MTNNNIFPANNFLTNSTQNINIVRLKINKGIVTGNIIDNPIDTSVGAVSCENSLIFVCVDNCQYIPLL